MGRVQDVILEDVKIGRSPLHFEPKRWTKPEHGVLNSNPLEAEHPTFVRALDFMCMGTDLGLMYAPAGVARGAAAGLGGLTSAGMAVWGVNKWQHGETALDRIEAVGSLALGAGYGLESLNVAVPLGGVGRNLTRAAMGTYAATDLFLGGVDAVRGDQLAGRAALGTVGVVINAEAESCHVCVTSKEEDLTRNTENKQRKSA